MTTPTAASSTTSDVLGLSVDQLILMGTMLLVILALIPLVIAAIGYFRSRGEILARAVEKRVDEVLPGKVDAKIQPALTRLGTVESEASSLRESQKKIRQAVLDQEEELNVVMAFLADEWQRQARKACSLPDAEKRTAIQDLSEDLCNQCAEFISATVVRAPKIIVKRLTGSAEMDDILKNFARHYGYYAHNKTQLKQKFHEEALRFCFEAIEDHVCDFSENTRGKNILTQVRETCFVSVNYFVGKFLEDYDDTDDEGLS